MSLRGCSKQLLGLWHRYDIDHCELSCRSLASSVGARGVKRAGHLRPGRPAQIALCDLAGASRLAWTKFASHAWASDEVATQGAVPAASALRCDAEAAVLTDLQVAVRATGNADSFWSCGDGDIRLRLLIVLRSIRAYTEANLPTAAHSKACRQSPPVHPHVADESAT